MGNKTITHRSQSVSEFEGIIGGIKYSTFTFQPISEYMRGIKGRSFIIYRDQDIPQERHKIDTTLLRQYILNCKQEIERNYSTIRVQDISQFAPGIRGRSLKEWKQKYTPKDKRHHHGANNSVPETHTDESHPFHENICGNLAGCKLVTNRYNLVRGEIIDSHISCKLVTDRCNFVRGEIMDSHIISEDFKGKENHYLHSENSIFETVVRSAPWQGALQDGCSSQRKRKGLENEEYKSCASLDATIVHTELSPQESVSDISDNESDLELTSKEFASCEQIFVRNCDALFQHESGLEMGKGSHESIGCIESEDHCISNGIGDMFGGCTCTRCMNTIPHSNMVNSESSDSLFHKHSFINQSRGSVEDFVLKGSSQELLCYIESKGESSSNEFWETKYALADRSANKPDP